MWKSNFGRPRHRRDVVPVTDNLTHRLISTQVAGAFRETQGPAHAFARCASLEIESEAFLTVCGDEWAKLGESAARASFVISCANALTRPPPFQRRGYDCVDASNTVDYAGLWNVLLALAPCVAAGGRLFTEHTPVHKSNSRFSN